jgi:hypothetical protein
LLGNILRTRKDDGNLTRFCPEGGQEIFINLEGLVPSEQSSIFLTSQTKSFREDFKNCLGISCYLREENIEAADYLLTYFF